MVTELEVLSIVPHCLNGEDGEKVYAVIRAALDSGESVNISFEGVNSLPTSFVNAALLQLLSLYSMEEIKQRLFFSNTTKHINMTIRERFAFEVKRQVFDS